MAASASTDLELMRAALLLDSDPAAAAHRAREILAHSPGHRAASLLLASAHRKLGEPAAAAAVLESLADSQRDSAFIQLELGRAYEAAERRAEALPALRRAVELDATLADGWRELAAQLFAAGETRAGDEAYARYHALTRDPVELSDAAAALADNRLEAATKLLREHLRKAPGDVVALRMLAESAARREDYPEAERRLLECLELAPGYALARYELARLLYEQHRNSEVLSLSERLLGADPHNLDYLNLKAQALRMLGDNQAATAVMEGAVAAHPQGDQAWLLYGHLLREAGEQARAIGMYRRALALRPESGRAYSSLANLKTFQFTTSDLEAMQALLAHGAARGADRIHLEFALGKALEDAGEFAASFEHYARGNRLQRETFAYDADAASAEMRTIRELYSPSFFATRRGSGSRRRDPIFIVGLPRCGSTLIEQMLSSHSQVEGTRELTELPALAAGLLTRASAAGRSSFAEAVAGLNRSELESLAEHYLTQTARHRPLGRARFVDKMLGNFTHLGLIHLMFPEAAIIDARRHPLGCGFSCFKQFFARGHGFTYDLREMGRYYRDYAELMQHYDAALPDRVHRVHYERLVADPEAELRRLLEYCGLSFEPQCLRFYETQRVVQTISSEQVRQPIYGESVDQWRHYEPWLGPLKEALGDLVERYPEARSARQ